MSISLYSMIITFVFFIFFSPINIKAQIIEFAKFKVSLTKLGINKAFTYLGNAKFGDSFRVEVNLKSRLEEYQNELTDVRWKFLYQLTNMSFVLSSKDVHRTIIDEKLSHDYIATLLNQSKEVLHTLILDWTYYNVKDKKTYSVLPVNLYYKPFATLPVCNNFGARSMWKNKVSCNITEEKNQLQIAANTLNVKRASFNNSVVNSSPFVFTKLEYKSYISLIPNAVINEAGNVINGDLIIMSQGCRPHAKANMTIPHYDTLKVYEEIFVTTQYWGAGYFHMTIENLPRLAVFIEFLRNHSNIRIHMSNGYSRTSNKRAADHAAESLAALGINPK